MIIKNLTRKNAPAQLISYILRYILEEEKQASGKTKHNLNLGNFVIRHNLKSKNTEGYVREFKINEEHRIYKRSNQPAMHHTILSWSDKDAALLTKKMLQDMAKQYIKLRGENNLYLGTAHLDRHHVHLHIACSATKLNGLANRMSKRDFEKLKKDLDRYQKEKYPELLHSLPMHGKAREMQTKSEAVVFDRRATKKIALQELLAVTCHKARSLDEFIKQVQQSGYELYYRAGKLSGIQCDGNRKYRLNSLGYDAQKIEELCRKNQAQEKGLEELHNIRNRQKDRTRKSDMQPVRVLQSKARETIESLFVYKKQEEYERS